MMPVISQSALKRYQLIGDIYGRENKKFAKNKIVRVLDAVNNDLTRELKALIKSKKARARSSCDK